MDDDCNWKIIELSSNSKFVYIHIYRSVTVEWHRSREGGWKWGKKEISRLNEPLDRAPKIQTQLWNDKLSNINKYSFATNEEFARTLYGSDLLKYSCMEGHNALPQNRIRQKATGSNTRKNRTISTACAFFSYHMSALKSYQFNGHA